MDFEEFVREMGTDWLTATVSRLTNQIEDTNDIIKVISAICIDFILELDLISSKSTSDTRDKVYIGLIKLIYKKMDSYVLY